MLDRKNLLQLTILSSEHADFYIQALYRYDWIHLKSNSQSRYAYVTDDFVFEILLFFYKNALKLHRVCNVQHFLQNLNFVILFFKVIFKLRLFYEFFKAFE